MIYLAKPKKRKKMSAKPIAPDVLICSCNNSEHQVLIMRDNNYPEVYVHFHLVKRPFWQRFNYAIKYILGYKSRYGAWDEFILNHTHIDKLKDIVNHLEDENLHSISYH